MRVLNGTRREWVETDESDLAAEVERHVSQVLLAEHLVVLAGLGTSRTIVDDQNHQLAPTMSDLWSLARDNAGDQFASILEKVAWPGEARDDIELLLSRAQMAHELSHDEDLETFITQTEALIVKACSFVAPTTDLATHEAFLRKVGRRSTRLPRTQLFTTNYDLAFESAAARSGFAIIDGFSNTQPPIFNGTHFDLDFARRGIDAKQGPDNWAPNVFQLHKLHGSVDWTAADGEIRRETGVARPLIIYPRFSKFETSYRQPFLEIMARFQAALRRPETGLLVIGFGFNDHHLTEPIMAALRGNVRLSAVIISPDLEEAQNPALRKIDRYTASGDRRLLMIASKFEDAVPVFPDLVPSMEAERHRERIEGTL